MTATVVPCGDYSIPQGLVVTVVPIAAANAVVSETAYGQAASAGVATTYARGDHTHGSPAVPFPCAESDVTGLTADLAARPTKSGSPAQGQATAWASSSSVMGLGPQYAAALGVVADGTTDDTAAMQAILNNAPSGSKIILPAGRIKISSTLTIGNGSTAGASTKNYLTIEGQGLGADIGNINPGYGAATAFEWGGSAGVTMIKVNGPITVHLRDFDLLGTATGGICGNGIELVHPMYSSLERVSVRRHGGVGLKITGYASTPTGASTGASHTTLLKVLCGFGAGTAWSGMELGEVGAGGDVNQLVAVGCAFNGGATGASLRLRYCDNNSFHQCTLTNYAGGNVLEIKPVAGVPLFPAEIAFYNCPMVGSDVAKTVVVNETDQAWSPYLTTVSFWPFPVGDAGGVPPLPNDVRFSGVTDSGIWFGKSFRVHSHIETEGTAPTYSLGAGAGTGATCTLSACTDTAGLINVTTGAGPAANDTVVRISYAMKHPTGSHVVLSPWGRQTSGLYGATQFSASGAATYFDILTGTLALSPATNYWWTYHVIGF